MTTPLGAVHAAARDFRAKAARFASVLRTTDGSAADAIAAAPDKSYGSIVQFATRRAEIRG